MSSDWRPIETAPKEADGDDILIFNRSTGDARVAYWDGDNHPDYPWHVADAGRGFCHHKDWPTHWMPVPKGPA